MAQSPIADIYAGLNPAGQTAFFMATEMEPPPSGEFILEGLTIDGDTTFTHIAGDGAGGAYVQLPDGRIFLISSEGEAAGIAPDLDTAMQIATGVGSLVDTLRFIKGDLEADRAAWQGYSLQWGLTPEAGGDAMLRGLGLDPLGDPFSALHSSVRANARVSVLHPNGAFVSFAR